MSYTQNRTKVTEVSELAILVQSMLTIGHNTLVAKDTSLFPTILNNIYILNLIFFHSILRVGFFMFSEILKSMLGVIYLLFIR